MLYDHIGRLREAGVTSLKIEGRMKSALYTAVTTGAYRHAVDATGTDAPSPETKDVTERWRSLLHALSHRPYTAGFAVGDETIHDPAGPSGPAQFRLMGILRESVSGDGPAGAVYQVETKNAMYRDRPLHLLTPDGMMRDVPEPELFDDTGVPVSRIVQGRPGFMRLGNASFTDAILLRSSG
jgi:putative protease